MDKLSRWIPKYKEPLEDTVIASLQSKGELKLQFIWELPVTLDQIKQEALRDEYINRIKTKILEKDQRTTDVFSTCNNVLFYREHVMIPLTLQKCILKDFHAGHPGSNWMKSLMHSFVYWTKILKTQSNYAKAVLWLLRYLILNSAPGQRQTFHDLGYTLTSLSCWKDFTISLLSTVSQSGLKYIDVKTQPQKSP